MIHPQHRQELLDSAIDEEVISLNFRSLEGLAAYYHLLYSDKLQRTNTGVLARGILKKYAFLDDGGCGVLALTRETPGSRCYGDASSLVDLDLTWRSANTSNMSIRPGRKPDLSCWQYRIAFGRRLASAME